MDRERGEDVGWVNGGGFEGRILEVPRIGW